MSLITNNLYQFSQYIQPMDFTIHQYLLTTNPAILFATGTLQQAKAILPELKELLNGKPLKYIFISHMESDEAGGLSVLRGQWPDVTVICGPLAARELPGYGYTGKIIAKKAGDELKDQNLDLQFFDYPAEVHLQNGLLCFEKNSGIFYSSDLFLRYGNGVGKIIDTSWKEEAEAINTDRVPNKERLTKLKKDLLSVTPSLVAVGHGFCLKCHER